MNQNWFQLHVVFPPTSYPGEGQHVFNWQKETGGLPPLHSWDSLLFRRVEVVMQQSAEPEVLPKACAPSFLLLELSKCTCVSLDTYLTR